MSEQLPESGDVEMQLNNSKNSPTSLSGSSRPSMHDLLDEEASNREVRSQTIHEDKLDNFFIFV